MFSPGFYEGMQEYFTHEYYFPKNSTNCGVDLRNNTRVVWNNTEYSPNLFAKVASDVVHKHDINKVGIHQHITNLYM